MTDFDISDPKLTIRGPQLDWGLDCHRNKNRNRATELKLDTLKEGLNSRAKKFRGFFWALWTRNVT